MFITQIWYDNTRSSRPKQEEDMMTNKTVRTISFADGLRDKTQSYKDAEVNRVFRVCLQRLKSMCDDAAKSGLSCVDIVEGEHTLVYETFIQDKFRDYNEVRELGLKWETKNQNEHSTHRIRVSWNVS